MNRIFSVDEIIDQNAFRVSIQKYATEFTPRSIEKFENQAMSCSSIGPVIWWCEIGRVFSGTIYIFESVEDYNKFTKLNQDLKFKINFIPWAKKLES